MRLKNEVKVGLLIFISILVLIGIYWFLGALSLTGSSYPIYAIFDNSKKLDRGSEIRMAGVKIGLVSDISLWNSRQARVDMRIWKQNSIPADSVATITVGGLVGDNYVDVKPGKSSRSLSPRDRISTTQAARFEDLMTSGEALLKELRTTAAGINKLVGDKDLLRSVKQTINSVKQTAENASEMVASTRELLHDVSPPIERSLSNVALATDKAVAVSKQLQDMLAKDVRPGIKSVIEQAKEVTANLNSAIDQSKQLIAKFGGTTDKADEALAKLDQVEDQARAMMTKLNEASTGIRDLATDKELHQNITETMKNAAEASGRANALLGNIGEQHKRGPTPAQKSAIPEYGINANALWNSGTGKYRIDANYTFAGPGATFYRAGAYNLGDHTKITAQGGTALDQTNAIRYGLYASEPGVGYDRRFSRNLLISTDVFSLNDPSMEMRGVLGINDSMGIYVGFTDDFKEHERDAIFGIRYQK